MRDSVEFSSPGSRESRAASKAAAVSAGGAAEPWHRKYRLEVSLWEQQPQSSQALHTNSSPAAFL